MASITPAARKTRRHTTKSIPTEQDENDAPLDTNLKSDVYTPVHTYIDVNKMTKTPANGEDTPTRQARLAERNELQSLNNRLELYILKQRERDASLHTKDRELDTVRQQAVDTIAHIKQLNMNEVNQLRQTRESQLATITQLEANELQLIQQLNETKQQLENITAQYNTEHELAQNAVTSQRELQAQLNSLQSQYKLLQDELNQLKKDKSHTDKLYSEIQGKLHKFDSEKQIYVQQLTNTKIDSEQHITQLTSQIDTLKQQLHSNVHSTGINRDERDSIVQQYTTEIQRLREQSSAEKEHAISTLKSMYDEKLSGYRLELERSGHELETERGKVRAMKFELKSIDEYVAELRNTVVQLTQRAEYAESALQHEKSNPELLSVIAQKNEQIRRIKQSFKRKDAEFDELMDVKVLLDSELELYRNLLETEEQRFEEATNTRTKKFKATHVQFQCTNSDSATVVLSDVDVQNKTIVIRSNTTNNIEVQDYQLKSVSTGSTYTLPQYTLNVGETLNIAIRNKTDKSTVNENTLVWKVKQFVLDSDTLELYDNNGNLLSSATVRSEASNVDIVDSSIVTEPAGNNCSVM